MTCGGCLYETARQRLFGRLVLHPDGSIDAARSDQRRATTTDQSQQRGRHAPGLQPVSQAAVGAVAETLEEHGLPAPQATGMTFLQADHSAVQRELGAARRSDEWRCVLPDQERRFDAAEMVTPTRSETGWEFPPLHVGIVVAPGWLLHIERATASVLVRYREDQAVRRRIRSFWRHRDLVNGQS